MISVTLGACTRPSSLRPGLSPGGRSQHLHGELARVPASTRVSRSSWPAGPRSGPRPQPLARGHAADQPCPRGSYPAPWHFLYFFPLPHGQGSLRPTFCPTATVLGPLESSPPTGSAASSLSFLRSMLRVKSCICAWAARRCSSATASAAAPPAPEVPPLPDPSPSSSPSSGYGRIGPALVLTCRK